MGSPMPDWSGIKCKKIAVGQKKSVVDAQMWHILRTRVRTLWPGSELRPFVNLSNTVVRIVI